MFRKVIPNTSITDLVRVISTVFFCYYFYPIQLVSNGTFPDLQQSVREADHLYPPTAEAEESDSGRTVHHHF